MIEIEGLHKSFEKNKVLDGLSLKIERGVQVVASPYY